MTKIKETPILFSGEMVRAILDGRKTQTRRVMKVQMPENLWRTGGIDTAGEYAFAVPLADDEKDDHLVKECKFPYGNIGDRLWVREAFTFGYDFFGPKKYFFRADHVDCTECADGRHKWKPSIYMPRRACRILLEITAIRVERLQDISEADALSEGVTDPTAGTEYATPDDADYKSGPKTWFAMLWSRINGIESWRENPWVWVIEFRRVYE